MPCSSEDDAVTRATSSTDGKEMRKDKAISGIARRTERSLQIKKGLMCKEDKISDQKQFRGDLQHAKNWRLGAELHLHRGEG